MTLCEKCLEDAVERTATEERWGVPLCGSCATNEDEAAYEASLSDYYGGSGAVTLTEQHAAADLARRALRRRD